jgi:hypothetical protein
VNTQPSVEDMLREDIDDQRAKAREAASLISELYALRGEDPETARLCSAALLKPKEI